MAGEAKTQEKASKVIPEGEHKFSDMVTFTVRYSKDFKGKKHLKESSKHKLHKLHADRLEAKGIGKVS